MRRSLKQQAVVTTAALLLALSPLAAAYAQVGPSGGAGGGQDDEDGAAKKKRDKEWENRQAPLRGMRNAGPCPYVKALYDAARFVEFKDGREASANVTYSGEIQDISAGCVYRDADPIKVTMEILFELGKGPQASSDAKTYRYWIAVTDRNRSVITKQYFDLPVKFAGKDRAYSTEKIGEITIPRAKDTTSGANFEVLVGFDVTPEMAAFNRDGKRFRVNAGVAGTGAASTNP